MSVNPNDSPPPARPPEDPSPTLASNELPPPAPEIRSCYFGDYELLEEIARGGMGVVFKARQLTLNRIVALKMILAGQFASEDDVQRFYTEAQTAAGLQHPNIVAIHEVGYQDGQHFFSMDYVEGQNLAALVRDRPLAPAQAVRYVKQMAEAIHHAHQHGTLHRDLKPSNVLIDRFDQPRVTDFGLARRLQGDQGITATGAVLGTPSYMPPEQAASDRGKLGPPTDVYSLGAVLYELVTGRPPFQAASPLETLLQVLGSDPAAPRLVNAAIDRDLETIILKCLAKEPERRYATAQDLVEDLDAYLEGRPIKARRPGVWERSVRWVRRHRRNAALIAVTATASVLILAAGWIAVSVYREGQKGRLQLNTHGPFLIAQVLDLAGKPATPRFTVPTQEPLSLPEGSYALRLSGQGGLAETFRLEVAHGIERHFTVDLKDQFLWEPMRVPRAYATVNLAGRNDVLLLSEKEVSLHHGGNGGTRWTCRTEELPADWKWDWHGPSARGTWESVERRPAVMKPAPDLDGGGERDVVLVSRQQAGLVALSGKNGKPLWSFLRRHPAEPADRNADRRHLRLSEGTVVGLPALADVDGDGKPDLVVTLALAGDGERPPQRWVEAISGRTGQSLWRYELDDRWFQPAGGTPPPYACRWFGAERDAGVGGGARFSPDRLYAGNYQRRLGGLPMPYAAEVVRVGGRPRVVLLAGSRLLTLDPATGEPVGAARDVGFWPARPPQFADFAGEGKAGILLCRQADGEEALELVALNLDDQRELWRRTVRATWAWNWYEQPPEWPLIADLDGDRRPEVIVPTGEVAADLSSRWVGLEVLEGATGQVRWQHPLVREHRHKRPLAPVHRFVVGPDLDGDGRREIFVVSTSWQERPGAGGRGEMPVFFVDALSGRTGDSLWWFRQALPNASFDRNFGLPFGPLRWWQRGPDGWPQLLVPRLPVVGEAGRPDDRPNETYLLSAGSGRLVQTEGDLPNPEVVDLDGDGIPDLLCFRPDRRDAFEGGGRLQAIRGRSPEAWRRLGGTWEPGQDLANEGVPALLAAAYEERGPANPLQVVRAVSGRDGRLLWTHETPRPFNRWSGERLSVSPLPQGDLNGDGVPDALSVHPIDPVLDHKGNVQRFTPLEALSGRTGRRLWTAGFPVRSWSATALLECHDLEGDGRPRVLLGGVADLGDDTEGGAPGRSPQLWLAVLSGQDGRLVWKQALVEKDPKLGGLGDLRLQPLVIDLNGDGVRDVVVPAVRPGKDPEVRVFSGRDGQLLWELPPAPRVDPELERDRVFLAAGDLDGHGQVDVVLLRTVAERRGTRQFETFCEVLILEGASGRVKGQWRTPVDHAYGQILISLPRGAADPIPLLIKLDEKGRRAIGV